MATREKLRVGIVGMGIRGAMFGAAVEQNGDAKLAAVSEISPAALETARERFNVPAFSDYREMIEKIPLDIMVVSTPDFAHKEPFLTAAAKGVDILVEKPFAASLPDAQAMYDAVKKNGIKCRVAFENRWNGVFVNLLERALDREATGEILSINATLNDTIYVPTKMLSWANKTNPAFFLLAHAADLACHIKGRPVKTVYATAVKRLLVSRGIDTYDSVMTHVVFDDATHAVFENSWIAPETTPMVFQFEMRLLGEKQAYIVNFNDQPLKIAGASRYEHAFTGGQTVDGRLLSAPCLMLHSFIDDVLNDRDIYSNEEDGMANMRLLDAALRSVESGEAVRLPT